MWGRILARPRGPLPSSCCQPRVSGENHLGPDGKRCWPKTEPISRLKRMRGKRSCTKPRNSFAPADNGSRADQATKLTIVLAIVEVSASRPRRLAVGALLMPARLSSSGNSCAVAMVELASSIEPHSASIQDRDVAARSGKRIRQHVFLSIGRVSTMAATGQRVVRLQQKRRQSPKSGADGGAFAARAAACGVGFVGDLLRNCPGPSTFGRRAGAFASFSN